MPRTRRSEIYARRVGQAVREARRTLGLSQAAVARRLLVSQAYIAAVEAGRVNPTVGQLAAIAEALQVGLNIAFPIPTREYLDLNTQASRSGAVRTSS